MPEDARPLVQINRELNDTFIVKNATVNSSINDSIVASEKVNKDDVNNRMFVVVRNMKASSQS